MEYVKNQESIALCNALEAIGWHLTDAYKALALGAYSYNNITATLGTAHLNNFRNIEIYYPDGLVNIYNFNRFLKEHDSFKFLTNEEFRDEFLSTYKFITDAGYKFRRDLNNVIPKGPFEWINQDRGVAISLSYGYAQDWAKSDVTLIVKYRTPSGRYVHNKSYSISEARKYIDMWEGKKKDKKRLQCNDFTEEWCGNHKVVDKGWKLVVESGSAIMEILAFHIMTSDGTTFKKVDDDVNAVNKDEFFIVLETKLISHNLATIAFAFDLNSYTKLLQKPGGRKEWYQDKNQDSFRLSVNDKLMVEYYMKEVVKL